MDVASYFPNISAVRHDEGEETAPSIDEEKGASTSTGKRGASMGGRKRHHDPVLSTIPEVLSQTSLLPADSSVICFLCLHKISGSIPNFVKPCQCPLVFVHTTCALDNTSFFGSTCSQCHEKYRPEAAPPRQTPSPVKSLQQMALLAAQKNNLPTALPFAECVLCHNQKYRTPEASLKSDAKLIRPCFCGFLTHHGCAVELLEREKACQFCGVKYRYVKYGSFADFCKRYTLQHICYVALFVFLVVFFVIAFRGSFIFRRSLDFSPIVLSVISIFFFFVLVFAGLFTIRHTILTRLPRFKRRYGQITVVPYDPDVRSKKEALRSLEAARFHPSGDEDVPLNTVAVVEVLEETPASDLSLGEYMFGVSKGHRITSSTPLNNKSKSTVFEAEA